MEALIEVYESDISRIKIGQTVTLVSENGGFDGSLLGTVERISPQVRQRNLLATDPTGDADARVVEVLVKLQPESANLVSKLTGMKIHSCSEYNDGKYVMVVLEHSLNINISGFPVKVYFTVMNDFNQDKSLSFGFSLNCNMSGNIFSNISNKIKINDTADLSCIKKDLISMFKKWKSNINKFKKEASLWSSVFFSKNLQVQAVNYMLDIDCLVDHKGSIVYNKDIPRLKLSKQLSFMNCLNEQTSVFGNNLWGFLNGVISYNKIKNDNFDFFNLFGLSNRNNQIAYKLCRLNESNSTIKLIKPNIF